MIMLLWVEFWLLDMVIVDKDIVACMSVAYRVDWRLVSWTWKNYTDLYMYTYVIESFGALIFLYIWHKTGGIFDQN